jgi:hypothetical protein
MSKFLPNLLVQISKICQKSKFQIKFKRISFLELWPSSSFWPSRGHLPSSPTSPLSPTPLGLGLPTDPAYPAWLLKWLEHSPLITSHHPVVPLPKWLITEIHYATTSPSMVGCLCSSPQPNKRRLSTPASQTPPRHPPPLISPTPELH